MNKILKEYLYAISGSIIAAFGTSCFLLPNQLSSGGFSGIATIIYYIFDISMGTIIICLNIPIFLYAYFREGKLFFIKTLISTFLFSEFINIFENVKPFITDRILASVYGGVIIGFGLAFVFKGKSSTGGTDLIANIIKSYNNELSIGNVLQIMDIIIVMLNMIFFKEIEIGLYSAIAIYITNKMLDVIFEGINFSKMIYIISDQYEKIADVVNKEVKHGATGLYGKGMYTSREKVIIMCVSKRKDIIKIKELARQIDKNSFIIITDVREVYGLGFKN